MEKEEIKKLLRNSHFSKIWYSRNRQKKILKMWIAVKTLFRRVTQAEVNLNKLVFNDLKKI